MWYVNLAWNNLLRNRRRTLSTLAVIGVGVGMIVFANGFTDGVAANMSNALVNQLDGHLRIQHRDYKKYYITDQEKILLGDYRVMATEIMTHPHVRALMPRVMMGGLIGKDDKSTTFFGFASDLATLTTVLPEYAKNLVAGEPLSAADPDGVLLGRALAKSLGVSLGDELVLLSKTIQGDQSNTLVHVRGVVSFPSDPPLEQSLLLTGLGKTLKDNLLDIGDAATQWVVRIDAIENVPLVEQALNRLFASQGRPWQVVPWYDSKLYSQMVGMFNGIGRLITIILTLMVGVIVSNALLMTFFERIREIGTLRAIGMRKIEVRHLLYTESALLGVLGTLLGLGLGVAGVLLGAQVGIPLSGIVNQEIHPLLKGTSLIVATAAPILCILIAAAVPIRAANRMSVIEALNYH